LSDHDARRCPLINKPVHPCVCKKAICPTCSTACSNREEKSHSAFSVVELVPDKGPPTIVCPKLDVVEMQARVRVLMAELPFTAAQHKNQRLSSKRRLAAIPSVGDGERDVFAAPTAQAAVVDSTGLGGASGSSRTRTAEATAAAAMDDGPSLAAAHIVGAYVSDTMHSSRATSVPPPRGIVADGLLARNRASTYTRIDAVLSTQSKYTPALSTAKGRVPKKVAVARGGGAETELLGSANPVFKWSCAQLHTAGMKHTQQTDPVILSQVRDSLTHFAITSILSWSECHIWGVVVRRGGE